jgi:DMSO/TMAO reductase YedYZ molybdopterin-dependent catalytic subunit
MKSTFLRFTSTSILIILGLLTITGLFGLMWPMPEWMFEVHRGASWALVALLPAKALISLASLRRGFDRRFNRSVVIGVSLILTTMLLAVIVFGLLWTWRIGPDILWIGSYGDAIISWHWMLALALIVPLAIHVWRRWPKPKLADFTERRSLLKMLALGGLGAAGWAVAETVARTRAIPEAARRHTGSREEASFSGLAFPVTHTLGQGQIQIDTATWKLKVHGAVNKPLDLSYDQLLAMRATDITATLDCTSGWYTTQIWRGIPLPDLLTEAQVQPQAVAIVLKDVSGYSAYFTYGEAMELLLSTHVGGQAYDHWHGFPIRAIAPSRRGWQWVKWLTEIEVVGGI